MTEKINARNELKGLLGELLDERTDKAELEAKAAAKTEADAKFLEEHVEMKARMDELQGKVIKLQTKTAGEVKVQ